MYKMAKGLPMDSICRTTGSNHEEIIIHAYKDKEDNVICISPELFDIIQEKNRFAIKRENQSLYEFGD